VHASLFYLQLENEVKMRWSHVLVLCARLVTKESEASATAPATVLCIQFSHNFTTRQVNKTTINSMRPIDDRANQLTCPRAASRQAPAISILRNLAV